MSYRTAQNRTTVTADRVGLDWTGQDDAALAALRAAGASIESAALTLGRTYAAVSWRLSTLGLSVTVRRANRVTATATTCPTCFTVPSRAGACLC